VTHVYVLTVTDRAFFGRTKHHSTWSSRTGAQSKADEVVKALVKADTSGLGNTYDVDICQMEVNH